jgi:hypothetical protein
MSGLVISLSLFLYHDRSGRALSRGFLDQSLEMLRDHIYENPGLEFIFIVLKDIRANLIAVSVSHAKIVVNFHLHEFPP